MLQHFHLSIFITSNTVSVITINAVQIMGKKQFEFMGDNHIATAIETPMRDDAFTKSD